jgi:hypothetical protein
MVIIKLNKIHLEMCRWYPEHIPIVVNQEMDVSIGINAGLVSTEK